MEIGTLIVGAAVLAVVLGIAALAAWFDDWRVLALAGNVLCLAITLPQFFETALCSSCWSNEAVAKNNGIVLLLMLLSAIFIRDLVKAAARTKTGREKGQA